MTWFLAITESIRSQIVRNGQIERQPNKELKDEDNYKS